MSGFEPLNLKKFHKSKGTIKALTEKEREFARLMAETGLGSIEAARKVFGWRCEQANTPEYDKAKNLAKSKRVKAEFKRIRTQLLKEAEASMVVTKTEEIQWDTLRAFAFDRLKEIRDNPESPSKVRYSALNALEKLADPSKDINLIYMWLDVLWRSARAHCPCCHTTFPLHEIRNIKLDDWRDSVKAEPTAKVWEALDLRLEALKRADKRKSPHKSQITALAAPERHVVGMAAARAGKSWLLACLGFLYFLLPGVEIWILARIYDDARSEVEYIKKFLNSLFYPHTKHLIKEYEDSKTGELSFVSAWGSELKIRSSKSKGSITGRELEAALVAEPGWVPEELYEEIRARMSSRLGRIFIFGTPKGSSGILGRMINMSGRDPNTGKIIRRTAEDRLISNGCPWNVSMLIYNLDPKDNPEYVQSELAAARMELTDHEYAAEFEGKAVDAEGRKFSQINLSHLVSIPSADYSECVWVVGIDQGERNFGGILVGWDGDTIRIANEYFEDGENTIKANLLALKPIIPSWIKSVGGDSGQWKLTIFDQNPPIWNILGEMEKEGQAWPTEWTMRHLNQMGSKLGENWRKETAEFINQMAKAGKLIFDSERCFLIHDQMMKALDVPPNPMKERPSDANKGWKINDPWRSDHVADALMFAIWTIYSNMIVKTSNVVKPGNAWKEAEAGFNYQRAMDEKKELLGAQGKYISVKDEHAIFENNFGRARPPAPPSWIGGGVNPGYEDC